MHKVIRSARQTYTRGASSAIPQASRLASAYSRGGVRGFIRAASGSGQNATWQAIERYARSGGAGKKLIDSFLGQLGPIGKILGAMVGRGGSTPTLPSDLRSALDFIRAFSDQPSVINALQRILEGQGARVSWPAGQPTTAADQNLPRKLGQEIARAIEAAASSSGSSQGGTAAGAGSGGGGRSRPPGGGTGSGEGGGPDDGRVPVNIDGQVERLPRNHPLVTGEMIETPESSNVYAFGFDNETHSLFVRFKDRPPPGQRGAWGQDKPHKPGPLYIYHNAAARLFLHFIDAPSKGNWVWDNLRVRGTLSGHQLDYALVGVQGAYVPRKATLTPQGEEFIPRTIFTDKGRSLSSPLPQELIRPLIRGTRSGGLGRPPNDGSGGLGGRGRRR